jgi:hypothetical protein
MEEGEKTIERKKKGERERVGREPPLMEVLNPNPNLLIFLITL